MSGTKLVLVKAAGVYGDQDVTVSATERGITLHSDAFITGKFSLTWEQVDVLTGWLPHNWPKRKEE